MYRMFTNNTKGKNINIKSIISSGSNRIIGNKDVPINKNYENYIRLELSGFTSNDLITETALLFKYKTEAEGFEFRLQEDNYFNILSVNKSNSSNISGRNIEDRIKGKIKYGESLAIAFNTAAFDISKVIRRAIKNSQQYVYLRITNTSGSNIIFKDIEVLAKDEVVIQGYSFEAKGMNEAFYYDQQEIATAGVSNINLFTGKNILVNEIYKTEEQMMPISLSHIFIQDKYLSDQVGLFGKGTNASFEYQLIKKDYEIELIDSFNNSSYYESISMYYAEMLRLNVPLDFTGNIYFNNVDNSYALYIDNEYEFYDVHGNIMKFISSNNKVVLDEITTVSGEITKYVRNNKNYVVSIQRNKSYSSVVSLTYNSSNYINEVRFEKEKKLFEFTYSGKNLVNIKAYNYEIEAASNQQEKITKDLLGSAKYDYSTKGIILAQDTLTGFGYKFEYFSNDKIKKTQIFMADTTESGEYTTYEYNDQTTKLINNYGDVYMYYFDEKGRNKQMMDKYGNTVSYNYDEIRDGISAKLIGESNVQNHSKNMLENHSFDSDDNILDGLSGWNVTKGNGSELFLEYGGVYGEKCLVVDKATNESVSIKQTIANPVTGTQTLSGFVKYLADNQKLFEIDDVSVKVNTTYSNIEYFQVPSGSSSSSTTTVSKVVDYSESYKANLSGLKDKWFAFSRSFSIPNGAYNLKTEVELVMKGKKAKVYFDDIQLLDKFGESKNRYNYVENGYMEYIENNRPKGWNFQYSSVSIINELVSPYHASNLGEKVIRLTPYLGKTAVMKKLIPMVGNAGDELIFSALAKSYATVNDIFLAYIKINYTDTNESKTYNFNFDTLYTDWQTLTRNLVAEYPYNSVEVGIMYDGLNGASFDAIQLYKDTFGKHYNYNEKGGLIEASNSEGGTSSVDYNEKNQINEVSDDAGDTYKYTYDSNGRIKTTTDLKGNVVSYDYDANGNKIKTEVRNHNQTEKFMTEAKYDDNNNIISEKNERRQETKNSFDDLNNLIKSVAPNGLTTNFTYNKYGELVEKNSKLELVGLKGTYKYDTKGQVIQINSDDTVLYNFEYDSFGNVTRIRLNNNTFAKYTYLKLGGINTGLVSTQQFGENGDKYSFSYDYKRRLERINFNNLPLVKYRYNDMDQVSEIIDEVNKVTEFFNYDLKGKLTKVTSNDATIKYSYDNLDSVQKTAIEIDDKIRDFDFEYKYEHNEYNLEGYVGRLDKAFKDDIILANHYADGRYGTKQILRSALYSSLSKTYNFNKITDMISLNIEKTNSLRQTNYSKGNYYSRYQFDLKYKKNKNVFVWIKPKSNYGKAQLLTFKNEDKNLITLSTDDSGKLLFEYDDKNIHLDNSLTLKLNEWNLIGINFNQNGSVVEILVTLNDVTKPIELLDVKEAGSDEKPLVEQMKELVFGNKSGYVAATSSQSNNGQQTLKMPFEIFAVGIGAFKQTDQSFKGIYKEGIKYIGKSNADTKSSSGVTYYNHSLYNNMDVITLNGSLESQKGNKPTAFTYTDKSYKVDKTQIFKLDETEVIKNGNVSHKIEKHVYGSYEGLYNLTPGNKSKLVYDLGLREKGTISIKFKLDEAKDLEISKDRYILSSTRSNIEKLGLIVNKSNELLLIGNNKNYPTGFRVEPKKWNTVVVKYQKGNVDLFYNLEPKKSFQNLDLDLIFTHTSIGAKIASNVPDSHLFGVLEMLTYSQNLIDDSQIDKIRSENKPIIVRKKYDLFDRNSINEILINDNRFVKQLEFDKTADNYTTLDVKKETTYDGGEINYTYDILGQVKTKTYMKNNKVTHKHTYSYDGLSRITEEVFEIDSKKDVTNYTYGKNNNINTINELSYINNIKQKEVIKVYKYNDINFKDKLTSINITERNGSGVVSKNYTNTLTYNDAFIGNPSSIYSNNETFILSWQGRRLTKLNQTEYKYNSNGIRVSKKNNIVDEKYILEGKNIIATLNLKDRQKDIYFNYDETGDLFGFSYKGEEYFYEKDVSRVINSIIDKEGQVKVIYRYNAWGVPEIINADGSALSNELIKANPFIYKEYFYDHESGWYYLKTRYYDPKLARFINADGEIGEIGDIANQNLFAYCANNPIMYLDDNGTKMKWWHKVLVGVAVIATIAVVAAVTVATGGSACIALGALTGAIKGAAIGAITGAIMGGTIGAVVGGIQTGTWDGALKGLINGAIDGAASGFMMGAITGAISGAINSKFCFVAGTLILTEQGLKAIEDIEIGDRVLSKNENTGEQSYKEVLDLFVNKHKKLIDIEAGSEVITTTPEHPFYVNNMEWKKAQDLIETDTLQNDKGEVLVISKISIYELEDEIDTYNFEVEEFHTYFVGENQILSHNNCAPKNGSPDGASRKGAFNQAKRDAGIPKTQQPNRILQNVNRQGKVVPGRVYDYGNVQITDDVMGHIFSDGATMGKHFNVDIKGKRSILHYFY